MSKFDTHGGYFAPKDYMRVNEGGSHEENPNGGVQIGVDPEGNPNLLEEGEPVYKDYVYSDNIEAEEQFLVDNNLPKKYTGKLYSKIADDLFSEAEERPLDPISRNGLETLLGRLADAQEGQKQAKEQRDLEDELASLSPEELEQLDAMLAQSEQEQMVPEQMPMEVVPEQIMGPAESMPVEGMPMMANGGFLRMFDGGGKLTDEQKQAIIERGPILDGNGVHLPSLLEMALGSDNKIVQGVQKAQDWMENSTIGRVVDAVLPDSATEAFAPLGKIGKAAKSAYTASDVAVQVGKWTDEVSNAQRALDAAETIFKTGKDAAGNAVARDVAKSGLEQARKQLKFAKRELSRWSGMTKSAPKAAEATGSAAEPATKLASESTETATKTFNGKKLIKGVIGGGVGATGLVHGYNYLYKPIAKDIYDHRNQQPYIFEVPDSTSVEAAIAPSDTIKIGSSVDLGFLDEEPEYKALGGKINRFDGGGWADFLKRLAAYEYSKNPSNVVGKYAIDRRSGVWGGRTARDIESDKAYQDFTNYVLANSDNADVREYLKALDKGVAKGTPLLFDNNGNLVKGWDRLFEDRRTDGDLGIYHLNPEDIGFLTAPAAPATTAQNPQSPDIQYELFPGQLAAMQYGAQMDNLSPRMRYAMSYNGSGSPATNETNGAELVADDTIYEGSIDPSAVKAKPESNINLLPTLPRYAGAIGSGLLGLYNVFQQPDRYTAPYINPQLPEGRINLQNQVYNPIDQNMIANAQIAQGNATNRALRNSGLGPSSAAAILAADNNLTGNLGTGFIQAWDANNQRRNAVIAANNQAEAQRAQFDYTVDAARKDAINRLAPYNAQNDLMVQRLNNQAEGDKYTAISNQISNGLQALSGIGQENFAMNQINNNPAFLGYRVGPNGAMFFNPNTGKWEKVKS